MSAAAVLLVTVVGALFIGVISSGVEPNELSQASIAASAKIDSGQDQELDETQGMVEKIGVISCLKPLDEDNPQTASCAIGLIQADGIAYALFSADPTLVGSLTSGQRVQIMGFINHQVTGYKTEGVISIHGLKRL